MLTVALAKGRILEDTMQRLRSAGFSPPEELLDTRKLVLEDKKHPLRYLLAKPSDVPVYVEHGAADLGVVGKDVLYESQADVHELIDLQDGRCRIVVAGPSGLDVKRVTRVATKYPRYAQAYFRTLGRQIEIIPLSGSVELAPIIGLSDCIVDLVETGRTLKENGLIELVSLSAISTRLIANRRSYQVRGSEVDHVVSRIRDSLCEGSVAQ
ncbi:ATP phosphoribosyltransferase [Ferroacidibacillus organovorans]|uniref:ATP phosphoribosyltransferase n=1 Tax=Ferroacidibacillus organovorans TaxID=1765683 RepID=A0A161PWS0_9BACL|nr:ATP phosphoribosyltransferase [Ferroacidibacillus organovorans]KYP80175.1 ATP phosphoribosyltransferase [Ferroacidibacillus organovorans]OAG95052.1 ATP phosphoribosyltransferase [Ferroacidibacillus organovorans]OPG17629.1 ATP phosphoribosyltransferase [Ferroacidibacillus organovorans]